MSTSTHILLIPGSFTPHTSLSPIHQALTASNIPSTLCPLPSSNPPDVSKATCKADVDAIQQNYLLPLLEQGKQVLIFAHSYGGIIAGGAATGFEIKSRTRNAMQGGVIGLVMLSAVLLQEGGSLQSMMGGSLPPFILQDTPRPGISTMKDKGTTHATLAFTSPAPKPAWAGDALKGRLLYLRTKVEKGLPDFQNGVIEGSGVEWQVEDLDAPHDAFNTKANEIVSTIQKCLAHWQVS